MRSNVVDADNRASAFAGVRELLVLWQHPETREIVPVGRLTNEHGLYSFSYTRAATAIDDFRPLPGLGPIGQTYVSANLPTIFRQRVMDSVRPDFTEYVASLGLQPDSATPWEQIVQSGGDRAGDTLQFMAIPRVVAGRARARFLANGVRYIPDGTSRVIAGRAVVVTPEEHEAVLQSLSSGDRLDLLPEEGNQQDPHATLVTSTGTPVGYAPRFLSPSIRRLQTAGPVSAEVVRVNGPASPAHLRLVLELNSPAPEGFSFDAEGRWEPAQ